ncbi:MAG: putative repair photolyase, partial [Bacteriovoracaceae bacterium]|nr:putative repair photolyase [Bacteriovoracaceae bacterium]
FDRKDVLKLDYFTWDLVDAVAEHNVGTLLAGVVRLSPVALKQFSLAIGQDYSKFFSANALKERGDKRFSDSEIAYYYKQLQIDCRKKGVQFTTCYIGNGEKDYFQYQDLWENKSDCCNARGKVSGFQASAHDVLHLHDKNKNVTADLQIVAGK